MSLPGVGEGGGGPPWPVVMMMTNVGPLLLPLKDPLRGPLDDHDEI